mmetsp:Transcript_17907/g.15813  ORF Transcript_17907/g.15813 Transcript_17907/m.15813 type:complete len:159 (+) Transcript_17907:810-1286(+)
MLKSKNKITNKEYLENDNFIDVIGEKEKRYNLLSQKYKILEIQNNDVLIKFDSLKKEVDELKRKLKINTKYEEIENIFTKLSSLILANKMDDSSLKFKERQLINNLFGGFKNPLKDIGNIHTSDQKIHQEVQDDLGLGLYLRENRTSLSSYKARASQS